MSRSPPAIRTLSSSSTIAEFAVAGKSWQTIGAEICTHRDFPRHTNVEFVRIVSEREIEIRIFERGVGPTASSGTGTRPQPPRRWRCAAAFRRSTSSLPAARKPLHGAGPATDLPHRAGGAHRPWGGMVNMARSDEAIGGRLQCGHQHRRARIAGAA